MTQTILDRLVKLEADRTEIDWKEIIRYWELRAERIGSRRGTDDGSQSARILTAVRKMQTHMRKMQRAQKESAPVIARASEAPAVTSPPKKTAPKKKRPTSAAVDLDREIGEEGEHSHH